MDSHGVVQDQILQTLNHVKTNRNKSRDCSKSNTIFSSSQRRQQNNHNRSKINEKTLCEMWLSTKSYRVWNRSRKEVPLFAAPPCTALRTASKDQKCSFAKHLAINWHRAALFNDTTGPDPSSSVQQHITGNPPADGTGRHGTARDVACPAHPRHSR